MARAAGFLGAKNTPQLLPHCHPVAIDAMDMKFAFLQKDLHSEWFGKEALARSGIVIEAWARSIGRTGIEMEVLTAVSVAALEIYDMLKPVESKLEIGYIRLLEKTGGNSDRSRDIPGRFSFLCRPGLFGCRCCGSEGGYQRKTGERNA